MKLFSVPGLALLLLPLGLLSFRALSPSADEEDRAAVERAGLDYIEGIYEVKPELIERSVHPDLTKFGFGRWEAHQDYQMIPMTYEQLLELAGEWNADGSNANEESKKEVEVLDMLDKIAAVKVTAEWGIDYMHLAKYDGKWMISQIIWQSHPMAEATEASAETR